ncbi:MAG: 50S ribosomal protein L9 [Spirochaetes bacterium]|nr:50S ribosomal protein L9 [Spirochaetota bacterium]
MNVILIKDVAGLGEEGDVKDVAKGYARNFLFPKRLAVKETPFTRNRMKEQKRKIELRKVKKREDAQKFADELSALSVNITAAAQENDKLFGAIHETDILKALGEMGYEVEKKNVLLSEPIKAIGVYKVPIKIYDNITAELKVWVVKE